MLTYSLVESVPLLICHRLTKLSPQSPQRPDQNPQRLSQSRNQSTGDGANGVPSPSALRLVVEESERGQDDAITQHPKTEGKLVLGPPFKNQNATPNPAMEQQWPVAGQLGAHIQVVV